MSDGNRCKWLFNIIPIVFFRKLISIFQIHSHSLHSCGLVNFSKSIFSFVNRSLLFLFINFLPDILFTLDTRNINANQSFDRDERKFFGHHIQLTIFLLPFFLTTNSAQPNTCVYQFRCHFTRKARSIQ